MLLLAFVLQVMANTITGLLHGVETADHHEDDKKVSNYFLSFVFIVCVYDNETNIVKTTLLIVNFLNLYKHHIF